MNHKIGRELVYDIAFLLSEVIVNLPNDVSRVSSKAELDKGNAELKLCRNVLINICSTVDSCEDKSEKSGINIFSSDEWKVYSRKCANDRIFSKDRIRVNNGQSFVTAYKSSMGVDVISEVTKKIDLAYEKIWKGEATVESIYVLNLYRLVRELWNKKKREYVKNINRIRNIIYGEKK